MKDSDTNPTRDPDAGIEGEGRPLAVEDAPLDVEYRSVRSVGHQPLPLRHMRNPRIIQRLRMFKPRPPRRRVPATVANLGLSKLLVRRRVYDSCSLRSSPFPVHGMGEQLATAELVEQGRKVDSLARIAPASPDNELETFLLVHLLRSTGADLLQGTMQCANRTRHPRSEILQRRTLSIFFCTADPPPEIEFQGRIRGVSVMGSDDWWKNTATRPKKISTGVPSHFIDPELFLLNLSFEVQRLSGHPAGNASL